MTVSDIRTLSGNTGIFSYRNILFLIVLCARAGSFLEELKAENNYFTRMWEQCGMKASNAADSQALIQLKKEYCDKKKCLYCRIGYEYLKRS